MSVRQHRPPSAPARGRHGASPLVSSRQLSQAQDDEALSPRRRPQTSLGGRKLRPQTAQARAPSWQADDESPYAAGGPEPPRRVYRPPGERGSGAPKHSPRRPKSAIPSRQPRPLTARNPRTYTGWGYRDVESPYVERVDMPSFCYPYEYMLGEPADVGDDPGTRPPTPGRRPRSARRSAAEQKDKVLLKKVSKRSVNRTFKRLGDPAAAWHGTSPRRTRPAPRKRKKKKKKMDEAEAAAVLGEEFPIGDGRQGTLDKLLYLAGNLRPGKGHDHLIKRVRTIIDKLHSSALARRAEHHRQSLLKTIRIPEPEPAANRHNYLGQESADDLEESFSESAPIYSGRVQVHRPPEDRPREGRYGAVRDASTATDDEAAYGGRGGDATDVTEDILELSDDSDIPSPVDDDDDDDIDAPFSAQPPRRSDADQARAATKIQTAYRGRAARKRVAAMRADAPSRGERVSAGRKPRRNDEEKAATNIQRMHRGRMARRRTTELRRDKEEQAAAATKIQARYRGHRARAQRQRKPAAKADERAKTGMSEDTAATKIQARYRGHRARRNRPVKKDNAGDGEKEQAAAATKIQARYRGHAARRHAKARREAEAAARKKKKKEEEEAESEPAPVIIDATPEEHEAAKHIQRAARHRMSREKARVSRRERDDHLLAYLSDSASLYNEAGLLGAEGFDHRDNSVVHAAAESESEREIPDDLLAEYALEDAKLRREANLPPRGTNRATSARDNRAAIHNNLHDSLMEEAYGHGDYMSAVAESEAEESSYPNRRYMNGGTSASEDIAAVDDESFGGGHRRRGHGRAASGAMSSEELHAPRRQVTFRS